MGDVAWVRDRAGAAILQVRLRPGARTDAVGGLHDGAVKISLKSPPVEGRANAALIEFVAERLSLPRARVILLSGITSRSKILRIEGKSAAEISALLLGSAKA